MKHSLAFIGLALVTLGCGGSGSAPLSNPYSQFGYSTRLFRGAVSVSDIENPVNSGDYLVTTDTLGNDIVGLSPSPSHNLVERDGSEVRSSWSFRGSLTQLSLTQGSTGARLNGSGTDRLVLNGTLTLDTPSLTPLTRFVPGTYEGFLVGRKGEAGRVSNYGRLTVTLDGDGAYALTYSNGASSGGLVTIGSGFQTTGNFSTLDEEPRLGNFLFASANVYGSSSNLTIVFLSEEHALDVFLRLRRIGN